MYFYEVNLGLKVGFQLRQILGLLGVYFYAVVVEVKTFLLLFRLTLAILCGDITKLAISKVQKFE